MLNAMFGKSFNSGRCKTLLKLAVSRIKLLKNKRDIQIKQMKRDLAFLLQTNQDPSARIRVEHIIREENVVAAYEIIELFCELIVVRLPIIESQRGCPIDLQEAISSLIFAAPRCADLPELVQIRGIFAAKYGKEFAASCAELRPDCGVNRRIIEKLSVRAPTGEAKLKMMKIIASEHHVDWDPTESEAELLKLPVDLLEGPNQILGASQIPSSELSNQRSMKGSKASAEQDSAKSSFKQSSSFRQHSIDGPLEAKPENGKQFIPFVFPLPEDIQDLDLSVPLAGGSSRNVPLHGQSSLGHRLVKSSNDMAASVHAHTKIHSESPKSMKSYSGSYPLSDSKRESPGEERFKDVAAAAQAAVESADRAVAAARAAAELASERLSRQFSHQSPSSSSSESAKELSNCKLPNNENWNNELREDGFPLSRDKSVFDDYIEDASSSTFKRNHSNGVNHFNKSSLRREESVVNEDEACLPNKLESDLPKFDDSPTNLHSGRRENNTAFLRSQSDPAPEPHSIHHLNVPSRGSPVHPKLPDYDDLAARFQALRTKR